MVYVNIEVMIWGREREKGKRKPVAKAERMCEESGRENRG